MPDINFATPSQDAAGPRPAADDGGNLRWDIIELLFFAYRDFVGDADHELEAFGFGRAVASFSIAGAGAAAGAGALRGAAFQS